MTPDRSFATGFFPFQGGIRGRPTPISGFTRQQSNKARIFFARLDFGSSVRSVAQKTIWYFVICTALKAMYDAGEISLTDARIALGKAALQIKMNEIESQRHNIGVPIQGFTDMNSRKLCDLSRCPSCKKGVCPLCWEDT